jgi:hypothetical protein
MIYVLYNNTTDEFLQCGRGNNWGRSFFYAETFKTIRSATKALHTRPLKSGTTRIMSYSLLDAKRIDPPPA